MLVVGRWFRAAAAAHQCSLDDRTRIHSLDGLRLSEAVEALDGELLEMEAGAEDSLDSFGPEEAGADGELNQKERRWQIIRKNDNSNLKCIIS